MAVKTRQCAGCGEYFNGKEMLRIVRTPEGEIRFDSTGRLSGRGVYLCRSAECVKKAFQRKAIARSLHVSLQPQTESDLETSVLKEIGAIEE